MDDLYFQDRVDGIIKRHSFTSNNYKESWNRIYKTFGKIETEDNEKPINAIY